MPRIRTKNVPIGTAPCPFKGCEKVGPLFRYRSQTDDPKKQRRAGKLYMRCEDHGVTSDQEWLLANATITNDVEPDTPASAPAGDDDAPTKVPAAEAVPAEPQQSAPAEPEPKTDDTDDQPFGFF